jgi:hypothetical protein
MALLSNQYAPLKPVIAIIGDEASKQTLTAYLKHQFIPQLNVISCVDAAEFASCLAPPNQQSKQHVEAHQQQEQSRKGILRADWLDKHQTRRPAVALVLVPRHHATGDPSAWATLAANLDAIRGLTKPTKIKVVIAVVQPTTTGGDTSTTSSTSLPDDRTTMLARHSGADRNCVILYEGNNEASMRSLGVLLQAQAAVFYSTNAQARLNSYSHNGLASVDANLRAAFKLGALAEVRGDWPGAVHLYKEAYGYVGQISMAGGAPLQRFLEVRTVAEVVHHRLLALLLGALRDAPAAATQLNNHLDILRTVPLSPLNTPASLVANHSAWLAQQFSTAAELVVSSGLPPSSFPPQMRPAQLYIEAFHAAATRRRIIQEIKDTPGGGGGGAFVGLSNKQESVGPGRYLGQIEIPRGNSKPLLDEQVQAWIEMEELESVDNSIENSIENSKWSCVSLLQAAKNSAAAPSLPSSSKLMASINMLLGEELLYYSEDIQSAKSALSSAAEQYRKDRWNGPLSTVLMALRECCAREGSTTSVDEHVTLSLEAISLDVVPVAQATVEELTTQLPSSTPAMALLVPEKAFVGEYLPAKVKIFTTKIATATKEEAKNEEKSSATGGVIFKNCRVVLSSTLPGGKAAATAMLFTKKKSTTSTSSGGGDIELHDQLEFNIKDLFVANKSNSMDIEIDFGFSVQAEIEETINISAELHYNLHSEEDDDDQEEEPGGVVEVHTAVPVLLPFECDITLAPIATTTTTPITKNEKVVGKDNKTIAGPIFTLQAASSPSDNNTKREVVEDVLAASLRSLSVSDAQLRRNLSPRLPQYFTLPAVSASDNKNQGTSCARVTVRKVRPSGQEWRHDAALEAITIRKVSIEAATNNSERDDAAEGTTTRSIQIAPLIENERELVVAELHTPGDVCCSSFILDQKHTTGTTKSDILSSLGTLTVSWRRSSPISLLPHYSSSCCLEDGHSTVAISTRDGFPESIVAITLPPVIFSSPLLTVQPFYSSTATAGEPMPLELELLSLHENSGSVQEMEVEIVVGEPHGFLIAGPRATKLVLSGSSRISFCLVPYHVGYLALPEVKVSVYGQKELVSTEGCFVYVKPGVVGGGGKVAGE